MAMLVGLLFGLPSLRIKGFYLAVATLASQFFLEWAFARIKWFTNYAPSGSVAVSRIELFGYPVETPMQKYLFVLTLVVVFALVAKNLVRSRIGRMWLAHCGVFCGLAHGSRWPSTSIGRSRCCS